MTDNFGGSDGRTRRGRPSDDDGEPAVIVDFPTGRRLGATARGGGGNPQPVFDGTSVSRPVVIFCHIRGDAERFPTRWKWGQLTIGGDAPKWRQFRLYGERIEVSVPAGTVAYDGPRPVTRKELSAFSPNPRRALVVELETPDDGTLYVGVQREKAPAIVAIFAKPESWPPERK